MWKWRAAQNHIWEYKVFRFKMGRIRIEILLWRNFEWRAAMIQTFWSKNEVSSRKLTINSTKNQENLRFKKSYIICYIRIECRHENNPKNDIHGVLKINKNRDGLKAYFYKVVGKIWEIEIKIKH